MDIGWIILVVAFVLLHLLMHRGHGGHGGDRSGRGPGPHDHDRG
jgi:hypothetical protein